MSKLILISLLAMAWLLPLATDAHQPQYVAEQNRIEVSEPEVSKAYYGELVGEPAIYTFTASEQFSFYVSLIVPDSADAETDFTLEISANGERLVFADGGQHDWGAMYEGFANDDYLDGPEYRLNPAPASDYQILVSSPDNRGRYVLVVGELEVFTPADIAAAYRVIPQLKSDFFGKSGLSFATSIFGAPFVVLMLLLGLAIGRIYRLILKRILKKRQATQSLSHQRNIGLADRLLRLAIAVALLAAGIYFWQPALLVASGFVFYEVAASWCALYSALGRNTCPL